MAVQRVVRCPASFSLPFHLPPAFDARLCYQPLPRHVFSARARQQPRCCHARSDGAQRAAIFYSKARAKGGGE